MVTDHAAELKARVTGMATRPAPAPWISRQVLVGGLTDVGFGTGVDGREFLLVVSHAGRGVFELSGHLASREPADPHGRWYDPYMLTAEGIGPLGNVVVPIAGLAGGGLPAGTADGWSVMRAPVGWPVSERVILEPPGTGMFWPGRDDHCVQVRDERVSELRAVGFSPSGSALVIAAADGIELLRRE
jgi:hypothetical protein